MGCDSIRPGSCPGIFGGIPRRERSSGSAPQTLQAENLLDRRELPLIRVVDAGPVLDPYIIPLPVYCQRVDHHEVVFEQFFQVHFLVVIVNPHGFRMSAVSADVLVARRRVRPICVSGLCPDHSAKLVKELLESPEAAARKIDRTHVFFFLPFSSPIIRCLLVLMTLRT